MLQHSFCPSCHLLPHQSSAARTCPLLPPEALKNEQKWKWPPCYRATGQSCPHAALVLEDVVCVGRAGHLLWPARAPLLPCADPSILSTLRGRERLSGSTPAADTPQRKPSAPKQAPNLDTSNQGPASALFIRGCQGHASSTGVPTHQGCTAR